MIIIEFIIIYIIIISSLPVVIKIQFLLQSRFTHRGIQESFLATFISLSSPTINNKPPTYAVGGYFLVKQIYSCFVGSGYKDVESVILNLIV